MTMKFHTIAILLLALLAGGCSSIFGGGIAVTNDTPQRQLVREASDVNVTVEAAYVALDVAYKAGKVKPAAMVAAKSYVDAIETGRKELMAQAAAGNTTAAEATKSAILASLSQIALAQLGVPITPLPTTQPAPVAPSDVPPPPPG